MLNAAVKYLYSRQNIGIKLGIENTFALAVRCGNPQDLLRCVQVVGTNGKGSTSAFLSNILRKEGYKSGLSTSPHLFHVRERIRINGLPIPISEIEKFIRLYQSDIEKIGSSFFEIITVMALWYFKNESVDIAILETGLGGRLDSTSICQPLVVLVTSISLDHTDILGNTISKIAGEKAGAFKKGIPVLSVSQHEEAAAVLNREARLRNTQVDWLSTGLDDSIEIGLNGDHQRLNASLALEALKYLPFPLRHESIISGLKNITWYGRFQVIESKPFIVFDVAHNAAGLFSFADEYQKLKISGEKILLLSLQAKKDISKVVPTLEKIFDRIICTETYHTHHMQAHTMAAEFSKPVQIIEDSYKAVKTIVEQLSPNDSCAILGTHYIGETLHKFFELSFDTI